MKIKLRRLNDEGINRFAAYLDSSAVEDSPLHLITDPITSEPIAMEITADTEKCFEHRYEFGKHLVKLLSPLDNGTLEQDRGLWTALCIVWFDQICPRNKSGVRKVLKEYRYILSRSFRDHYRHLVCLPWKLVRDHQEKSTFMLLPPKDKPNPLTRNGEILEQLGGRQTILRSKRIVAEVSHLYTDPQTGRPLVGVSGAGRGSARRLGLVLRQLDLTYDAESMTEGGLIKVLPKEFERWNKNI